MTFNNFLIVDSEEFKNLQIIKGINENGEIFNPHHFVTDFENLSSNSCKVLK